MGIAELKFDVEIAHKERAGFGEDVLDRHSKRHSTDATEGHLEGRVHEEALV